MCGYHSQNSTFAVYTGIRTKLFALHIRSLHVGIFAHSQFAHSQFTHTQLRLRMRSGPVNSQKLLRACRTGGDKTCGHRRTATHRYAPLRTATHRDAPRRTAMRCVAVRSESRSVAKRTTPVGLRRKRAVDWSACSQA
jgi:hypothetical protein